MAGRHSLAGLYEPCHVDLVDGADPGALPTSYPETLLYLLMACAMRAQLPPQHLLCSGPVGALLHQLLSPQGLAWLTCVLIKKSQADQVVE